MLSGRTVIDPAARWPGEKWLGELPGARGFRAAQRAASLVWSCLQAIGRAESRRTPAERAFALHQLCADICRAHAFDVHSEGEVPDGAAMLVANHLSYLDPIMVAVHRPLALIGKLEVERWPIFGDVGRTHGVMFINRGDAHSGALVLRRALRMLRAGIPVLNFPEGTTTHGKLLPFARGVFGIARIARVPVVPVAISFEEPALHWVGDDLFLPHYLRTAARPRTVVRVRYGDPLDAPMGVRAELVAAAARARISAMLEESL